MFGPQPSKPHKMLSSPRGGTNSYQFSCCCSLSFKIYFILSILTLQQRHVASFLFVFCVQTHKPLPHHPVASPLCCVCVCTCTSVCFYLRRTLFRYGQTECTQHTFSIFPIVFEFWKVSCFYFCSVALCCTHATVPGHTRTTRREEQVGVVHKSKAVATFADRPLRCTSVSMWTGSI